MRIAPNIGMPTITELPLPLEVVGADPFIADLPVRPAPLPTSDVSARRALDL
jgi:hypothetical protein